MTTNITLDREMIDQDGRSRMLRSRWAAIGAAVAVTIGIGGIAITNAAEAPNTPSAFVPMTPCRLFDTRSIAPIGPRSTPLGNQETYTQQVTGTNGNCTVPTTATGVAMNVTIDNPTSASFLTVWPSDAATRPLASNLNWVANGAPTPNKVDVKLSTDGKISLFNNAGTVNVLADVVGYYTAVGGATGPGRVFLDPGAFHSDGEVGVGVVWHHDFAEGRVDGGTAASCGIAQVTFPNGATITSVTVHIADGTGGPENPGNNVTVKLWRNELSVGSAETMFSAASSGAPGNTTLTGSTITGPLVDTTQFSYYATVCGIRTANFLYDFLVNYTTP